MPEKIQFIAQKRSVIGKKAKTVRGVTIPANISGNVGAAGSLPVLINRVAFSHLYEKVGDTGLVYVQVDSEEKERPVLVNEVQKDPISRSVLHVVFRQVDLTQKVTAEVPVVIVGELGVKEAVLVTVHNAIKVEALPQDLPEKFEINISQFQNLDDMVTFEQLEYDENKVTLDIQT